MGIFSRKKDSLPAPGILTASGARLDLSSRQVVSNYLGAIRSTWQNQAWDMHEAIGELTNANRLKSQMISRCKYYPALLADGDDHPYLLTSEEAIRQLGQETIDAINDACSTIPINSGYRFSGLIATNFDVAGECFLYGREDPENGSLVWKVLSTSQVVDSSNVMSAASTTTIQEVPGIPGRILGQATAAEREKYGRDFVPQETMIRLWIPSARYEQLATSPMKSMLGVCENILLYDAELRVNSSSRVATNGILKVPEGMMLAREDGRQIRPGDSEFANDLAVILTAPIRDPNSVEAVVPAVLSGSIEDLNALGHLTLERTPSEETRDNRKAELERLRESLDLPPEMMSGLGDSNHWSGALITANTFRDHGEPTVRMIVDSLTDAFLRPMLVDLYNIPHEVAQQIVFWYDAGAITEPVDNFDRAKELFDRGELSGSALRSAAGVNEADAPDQEERERIFEFVKASPYSSRRTTAPADSGVDQLPSAEPEEQPNAVIRASATRLDDDYELSVVTNRALGDLDASLVERIVIAADAAVNRAVEKASAQTKASAQGKPELASILRSVSIEDVCCVAGEAKLAEFGILPDGMLTKTINSFHDRFVVMCDQAIHASVKVAARVFGLSSTRTDFIAETMIARIEDAWKVLSASLLGRAQEVLYGRHGDSIQGESTKQVVVRPGDVRDVLGIIGGLHSGSDQGKSRLPMTGIGTGPTIKAAIEEQNGESFGLMWNYRDFLPRTTFLPHKKLDDHRFDSVADPRLRTPAEASWLNTPFMHPGDHRGCLCTFEEAWILPRNVNAMTPELTNAISSTLSDESTAMREVRMLAEMDDRAGRHNTTAQRERDARDRILRIRDEWLHNRKVA